MKFLKTLIFFISLLSSSEAFSGSQVIILGSDCGSTGSGVCTESGPATISTSNSICYKGPSGTGNNCTGAQFTESYLCSATQVDCNAMCASACNKIKAFILNPGIADVSASTSSNSFTRSICNALRVVTGSAGKTFAAFAIIAVGIGFFSGKVSWGLMIGVAAGIAAMFGAPSVVAAISGQNTDMMCNIN